MKRQIYIRILVGIIFTLIPCVSLAAADDAVLTTEALIQIGGHTLNIVGSAAAVQSITVDADSFSVTLGNGSSIWITSPDRLAIQNDVTSDVVTGQCNSHDSSLKLAWNAAGTVTNTISLSGTACSDSTNGGGGSSGGGGGYIPPTSSILPPASTLLKCPVGYICTPKLVATSTPAVPQAVVQDNRYIFNRDLQLGSLGQDVKALQQYLNAHSYRVASLGSGSPGNETPTFGNLTKLALIRFQKDHKIPGTGYFGPITRAYVNSH